MPEGAASRPGRPDPVNPAPPKGRAGPWDHVPPKGRSNRPTRVLPKERPNPESCESSPKGRLVSPPKGRLSSGNLAPPEGRPGSVVVTPPKRCSDLADATPKSCSDPLDRQSPKGPATRGSTDLIRTRNRDPKPRNESDISGPANLTAPVGPAGHRRKLSFQPAPAGVPRRCFRGSNCEGRTLSACLFGPTAPPGPEELARMVRLSVAGVSDLRRLPRRAGYARSVSRGRPTGKTHSGDLRDMRHKNSRPTPAHGHPVIRPESQATRLASR